ncbi:hypothetical protein SAMN05216184_1191, partial [Georgenia satyanarayanai]
MDEDLTDDSSRTVAGLAAIDNILGRNTTAFDAVTNVLDRHSTGL